MLCFIHFPVSMHILTTAGLDSKYLSSSCELVEDMIVSLFSGLGCDPGLFKQVVLNEATLDLELGVETDLHETSKSR